MENVRIKVRCLAIEEYNFEYEESRGLEISERFPLYVNDLGLKAVEIYQVEGLKEVPYEKARFEDNDLENYREISFFSDKDVLISLVYEKSPKRVAFEIDLSNIRSLLAATDDKNIPSPASFFYTDSDDIRDDTHIFDENETYYFDDFEGITFIVRLKEKVDLRLELSGEEYLPEEVEEKRFGKSLVYEYRFGSVDDYDPKRRNYRVIRLKAPKTVAKFIVK